MRVPTTTECGPVRHRPAGRCARPAKHKNSHTSRTRLGGLHTRSVTGTYTATPSGGSATGYSTAYVSNLAYSDTGQLLTGSLGQLQGNTNLSAAVNLNYTYEPDTLRLSTAKVGIAGAATLIADQTATYDSSGLPTVIKDVAAGGGGGVGQVECYRYDSQQRLTAYLTQAVTASPCASLTNTDVTTANVLQASGPDGYAALYTLDDLGQLTKLVERRPTTSAGSMTSMVTSTITRDPIRVHAIKDVARVDNIANAALPAQAFQYDGTGRQTKRTLPTGSRTVGDISNGVTTEIGYDGNGRMVSMTDTASSGTAARRSGFVYDASGALIARHDDDAGDDLAATGTRPAGQRTVWLGTGGSAGIGAIGMAGTGGLQIQISRKPGASATTAGTASAADPAQQLVTVTRSVMAPVLANGGLAQVASHTASALLSTVTTGGVLSQAPAPLPGRVWFTVGDAHASLGGAGSPSITIAGNGASSDPASAHSQSVTVAGAGVAAWNGATTPPAVAPAVGIRRTTPYGGDRTAPATAAPAAGGIGATGAATSKNGMAGSMGGNGFLNAIEDTLGSEDGPALPGAPTITGSGYPTTGLILLGARGYDPALGEFTAADPVSNPMNPADAGCYTYANHRLGLASDPTGLYTPGHEGGAKQTTDPNGDDSNGPTAGVDHSKVDPIESQTQVVPPWPDASSPFSDVARNREQADPAFGVDLFDTGRFLLNSQGTVVGLSLAAKAHAHCSSASGGMIVCLGGGWPARGGGYTIGNVFLTTSTVFPSEELLRHEAAHSTQQMAAPPVVSGLFYSVASAVSWRVQEVFPRANCKASYACYNVFEMQANLKDGGYLASAQPDVSAP